MNNFHLERGGVRNHFSYATLKNTLPFHRDKVWWLLEIEDSKLIKLYPSNLGDLSVFGNQGNKSFCKWLLKMGNDETDDTQPSAAKHTKVFCFTALIKHTPVREC